jgi:tetratricopeptide (TPR) repeat protein
MASKSSTIILPFVLGFCLWWMEGRWKWRHLATLVPLFVFSIAAGLVTAGVLNLQHPVVADFQWTRSWPERLAGAGDAIWFYLGKLLWPYPLMAVYPRWKVDPTLALSYLPLLLAIIVMVVFWLKSGLWARPWFFAFAYFVIALLPVLGFSDNTIFRFSFVFDHFQYLAAMGPLALVGGAIARLPNLISSVKSWVPSTLGAGLLVILGALSWQRAWLYENSEMLWTDALAKNPNCWVAYLNLSNILLGKGGVNKAIAYCQKAVDLYPYVETHYNLGIALAQGGRLDDAAAQYKAALKIDPNYANAHNNLGLVLVREGRLEEGAAECEKALVANPNLIEAHYNLGNLLEQQGKIEAAVGQYREAVKIKPSSADAHNNLGYVLMRIGKTDEGVSEYEAALAINPNFAEAHNNLGIAFAQSGQLEKAIDEFKRAVELKPDYVHAHENLNRAEAALRTQQNANKEASH